MESIDKLLKNHKVNNLTVNSNSKDIPTVNSSTVYSSKTFEDKLDELIESEDTTKEGLAKYIAEKLDDTKSLTLHILLVKEHKSQKLLEALNFTLDAWRNHKIRTSKPIYYIAILRRWKMKVNFRT
ncbi:MAG TPA: hypothetical protein VGT05_01605 [Patescibacteria group bacterium]|nr:hypothetical protein [Patescibacteria group bacterium]